MDSRLKKNKFYLNLFRKCDETMSESFRKNKSEIQRALDRVEKKLNHLETSLHEHVSTKRADVDREMSIADALVNRELKAKIIMSDWCGHFLSDRRLESLDPVTFAFTRYSLSICLSYADVSVEYFVKTNVHKQLVDYIHFDSELVVGPALMALAHLSIHEAMQPLIVLAGALPALCKILTRSTSKPVLCQACKLTMGLAQHFPNKTLIVNSGCHHGLLDLVLGTKREIDDHVQCAALGAICNVALGNDACRSLTVDLDGVRPIITAIQTSQKDVGIIRGIKALANVAFCSSYTAGEILKSGGHLVLLESLQITDILHQPAMAHAALAALSDLCNNENCQTLLAAAPNLCETAVRICELAKEPYLVAEAATLLLAIMWRNSVNKARVSTKGACKVLVRRMIKHSPLDDEPNRYCAERVSFALASMLLNEHTHELMHDIGGFQEAVAICKKSKSDSILRAVAQVIVAMIPSPDYLVRCHDDLFVLPVEKVPDVLPVLKKVGFNGFGSHKIVPEWLEKAMLCLSMDDDNLRLQPRWLKDEFSDRMTYAREFRIEVEPDADVFRDVNCRGLLLSTF
jgi:hypothetical protein